MDSFACGFETRCFAPQTVEATGVSFRLIESRNRFLCFAYTCSFNYCALLYNLQLLRRILFSNSFLEGFARLKSRSGYSRNL